MAHYTAISLTLSGDKIEKREFCCRKLATAQGCLVDFSEYPVIVKLHGKTDHWFIEGRWYAGLAAQHALSRIGYTGYR
jgi:hypothetical protein